MCIRDRKHAVLTDIQGMEDSLGEMDFKVAGTVDGITAIQMDIKVDGITIDIMREALAQAKKARLSIIDKLKETLPAARTEMSPYAPRMLVVTISPDKIKDVIGPGGKVINLSLIHIYRRNHQHRNGTGVEVLMFGPKRDLQRAALVPIEALTGDDAEAFARENVHRLFTVAMLSGVPAHRNLRFEHVASHRREAELIGDHELDLGVLRRAHPRDVAVSYTHLDVYKRQTGS